MDAQHRARRVPWRRVAGRAAFLVVAAVTLYVLAPKLVQLGSEVPQLVVIDPWWFVVMAALEVVSFACTWALLRQALPSVSWFVAATSQLVSNAISKTVPGGAAVGTTEEYRMLSASGIERGRAATALAANSIISNGVLFSVPLIAVLLSLLGARIPPHLHAVVWGGAILFVILFAVVFAIVDNDRVGRAVGRGIEVVARPVLRLLRKDGGPTAASFLEERDAMKAELGTRWRRALAAAVGNWLFDYLALVCALYAVGTDYSLSLVLLAYATGAVLGMVPLTPGGLGLVEVGLTGMLQLAHIPLQDALLATLAYRLVSFWLPIPFGFGAHLAFRHRFPHHAEAPAPT